MKQFAIALAIAAVGVLAHAESCPQFFLQGQAPTYTNDRMSAKTTQLCYLAFSVGHSGVTRTPLWSAEHLTRDNVIAARSVPRKNSFHAEPRIFEADRSELTDFSRSGLDRGHLTPSHDAASAEAQYDTFSLANIIPQSKEVNEILWEGVESATRDLAVDRGELYVVTGPLWRGANQRLRDRVMVPTGIFKAIYDPASGTAAAYVAGNGPEQSYKVVSIEELEGMAGINLFPALSHRTKHERMELPTPTPHGMNNKHAADGNGSHSQHHYGASSLVMRLLGQALR